MQRKIFNFSVMPRSPDYHIWNQSCKLIIEFHFKWMLLGERFKKIINFDFNLTLIQKKETSLPSRRQFFSDLF